LLDACHFNETGGTRLAEILDGWFAAHPLPADGAGQR
ncbi:MAG: hypothetical protein RLZZ501_1460, partial [Pseudomonadota bacterium]